MSEATHFINESADPNEANQALWANEIKTFNNEKLVSHLSELEEYWDIYHKNDPKIPYRLGYNMFFLPDELDQKGMPKVIDIERVVTKYVQIRDHVCEIYHKANELKMLEELDKNDQDTTLATRINRLIDQVDDAWTIVFRAARIMERVNNPTYVPINPESDPAIFRMSTINKVDELSPYQQSIMQCLKHLYSHNIRRYKGYCCEQIMTKTGCPSRAWKPKQSISEFVYSVGRKETWFDLWKNLTSRGTGYKDVITHLTNINDMQFPDITKNRHVWSFDNGVFVAKKWSDKTGLYTAEFYDYESKEFKSLDQSIVSCKYFDQEFPNYNHLEDWYDIPTPHFKSIFDYQQFDEDVARWIYVMCGRLCYDVNDLDGWQVIPFLKGVARSGKSTIITKVLRKFYCTEDVRTLSNNVERKFGLSAIKDAFMFIAPEVKNDLALEQAEFQSIVSGEDVSIAVKHEKAHSMEWTTPGILGGNEVPHWKDNSGSVLRRILTVNFGKQVKDADPTLEHKLEAELPCILQKCVRAYLEYSQKYAKKDIWNVVPSYFKDIQKQIAGAVSTLENFMQSHHIKIDPEKFCTVTEFVKKFNTYCSDNNLGKPKFGYDFYIGPFSQRDIYVKHDTRQYGEKYIVNQQFIFGLGLVEENPMSGNMFGNDD